MAKEIIVHGLGKPAERPKKQAETAAGASERELSDITVGEEFQLENIIGGVTDKSSKLQKRRAAERVQQTLDKIMEFYGDDIYLSDRVRKIEEKLHQTDVWQALSELKKKRASNKKVINSLITTMLGAVDMMKAVGIPMDDGLSAAIRKNLNREV